MKLGAGELNQRVTFVALTQSRDATFGSVTTAASDLVAVWAKRDSRAAGERLESDAMNAVRAERFFIRYRAGLDESMQLRWRNVLYKITGISEVRNKETLQIDCEIRNVAT